MFKRLLLVCLLLLCLPLAWGVAQQAGSGRGAGDGGGGGTGGGRGRNAEEHGDSGVKKFGAVGDGRADDTSAIQRAIDAKSGDIKLPPGVFRITRPLVVDLDKVGFTSFTGRGTARIVMAGPGPAIRFVGTHGGTADPHTVQDNVWDRQRMPIVNGIEIVGEHDEAIGIQAAGTMQLTVTRVVIRHVLHGIHLVERNRNVIISNCHIYENRGVGVYLDDVNLHQFNMGQCHVSYNHLGGVVVRAGNMRNLHIGACDIEGNFSPDGPATANVLLDCTGGSVAEVAITGCTIQHTGKSPESANIRMLGADKQATTDQLRAYNYGNVTIAGNVLSDVQLNIDLAGARTVSISGNTLWKGFTNNIRITDSSHVVLGANVLDRNPRYQQSEDSDNSVLLKNCRDCTISGLHILGSQKSEAGLVLENCRRMNVTGCTILDCDGAGLVLRDCSDCTAANCLIRDDREAGSPGVSIRVEGGRGNFIVDNRLGGKLEVESGAARIQGNYQDDDAAP
ncbi:MAG: right-handed parallel beta-helix repeat-containing protein [Pirellulaceae bacterium]